MVSQIRLRLGIYKDAFKNGPCSASSQEDDDLLPTEDDMMLPLCDVLRSGGAIKTTEAKDKIFVLIRLCYVSRLISMAIYVRRYIPDQVVMQNIVVDKVASMSSEMYKPGFEETDALFPSLERTLTWFNFIYSFASLLENTDCDVVKPFKESGDYCR
jgi:hypothetical protein